MLYPLVDASFAGVEPAVRSEGFEPSLGGSPPIAVARERALAKRAHTSSFNTRNRQSCCVKRGHVFALRRPIRFSKSPEMKKAAEVRDLGGFFREKREKSP